MTVPLHPRSQSNTTRIAILAALLLSAIATTSQAGVPQLDAAMDRDPPLPTQRVERHLPPRWEELWREALTGPEEDLRREAATAILREHQLGCPDLEGHGGSLMHALSLSEHPTVRLTIALALVELDVRAAADQLFELAKSGGANEPMALEPALARWDHKPMREVWLARLSDPSGIPQTRLLLAIDGVRTVRETRAITGLRRLALDRAAGAGVRLAAARALGELQHHGLAEDARRLAADPSARAMVDRLAAAHLLAAHRSEQAQHLLLQLAADSQPAVVAVALRRLLEIEPDLVKPRAPVLLESPDAVVRRLAARSLFERPSLAGVATLGKLLDDPHPEVRGYARESMLTLAQDPELAQFVRNTAMDVLASDGWRGLEQAARLLGELEYEPAAPRLVELLYFDRAEVHVTAAWSLGRLAVRETLPDILAFARSVTDKYPVQPGPSQAAVLSERHDAALSHVFQMFGLMRYAESEPVLLKFVPRRYDLGPRSRGAAIWALGYLHENDPRPELMNALGHRVADEGQLPFPEPVEVRANAAISLGRMNAAPALIVLRLFYEKGPPGDRNREACGWAIEQITDENLPDPETKRVTSPAPFLQPLDP